MALPTINLTVGYAKDLTLEQVTSTDLDSTYTRVELRSEDLSDLVLSSADAAELEITGTGNVNVLVHMPSQSVVNKRYKYYLAGISGGETVDLAGHGYIVVREEP